MLDAITKIEEYTSGINYESFMDNPLLQDGLIRQIEIIGEATKRLSKEIRDRHPEKQSVSGFVLSALRPNGLSGNFAYTETVINNSRL
jgi:hypothetical protein